MAMALLRVARARCCSDQCSSSSGADTTSGMRRAALLFSAQLNQRLLMTFACGITQWGSGGWAAGCWVEQLLAVSLERPTTAKVVRRRGHSAHIPLADTADHCADRATSQLSPHRPHTAPLSSALPLESLTPCHLILNWHSQPLLYSRCRPHHRSTRLVCFRQWTGDTTRRCCIRRRRMRRNYRPSLIPTSLSILLFSLRHAPTTHATLFWMNCPLLPCPSSIRRHGPL